MLDLDSSSLAVVCRWCCKASMKDAEQGGTETAALSEANGWALAVPTLTTNLYGKQRAIIQGLEAVPAHA